MIDPKIQKEQGPITDNIILQRFHRVRQQSINLCKPLQKEDYVVQPVVDVSPPKWHLGHTTWFFETFILQEFMKNYKVFDEDYNYMFNSYYEAVGDRVLRTDRGNMSRPSVDDVLAYREYVDQFMTEFLEQTEVTPRQSYVMEVGLQHEQQHQELLVTDIKYIFGNNPLFPVYKTSHSSPDNYREWDKYSAPVGVRPPSHRISWIS